MNMGNSRYRNKMILLCAGLIISLLILSAYSNSLYAPFVLDDFHSFVKEPKVLNFTFDFTGLKNLATTKFGVRRFLPMLTFAFDQKWGHGSLVAYHVTNIAIHLLATLSLFFLLQSLFLFSKAHSKIVADDNGNNSNLFAIVIVTFWALNPVQTNAVTYIVQRMTSIAALFYFLSLGCYVRGRFYHLTERLSKKSLFFYITSLICFISAMMSKEIAATLPVMAFLIEWLFVEDSGLFTVLKKYKIIFVLLSILIIIVISYKFCHGWLLSGYAKRHFTLSERLLTELRIVASYCALLLLPLPQWLNLEHDVALSTSLFSPLSTFFSLVFIIVALSIAWKVKAKQPLIAFGIFWFFINLVIESSIISLELKFEHRLYLPSAGFYLIVVLFAYECYAHFMSNLLPPDRLKVFLSIAVILCSGLSYLTYTRNMVWKDSVSLWQDCISKAPNKARTHSNLATAWLKRGENEKALEEGEKAIALGVKGYEEYWVAACNIVSSLSKMGKHKKAVARGEALLGQAPQGAKKNSYSLFLLDLGEAYCADGNFQSAFDCFLKGYKFCYRNNLSESCSFETAMMKALHVGLQQRYQFDPGMELNLDNADVTVDQKMAHIFFELKNFDLALHYVEKVMIHGSQQPEVVKIKNEIEKIFAADNEQKKMGTLKEKYCFHPFDSQFHFFMALCVVIEKHDIPANSLLRYCLKRVESLNAVSPDVYLVKSWYFYQRGEYKKALEIIDQGIRLNPKYAHLWINRGIYALANNDGDALVDFDKALSLYPGYPHRKKILAMQGLAEKLIAQRVSIN